jgi:NAD(P)-dependent dehydrogenase (short-subunit alcohol dehydrogenase family)
MKRVLITGASSGIGEATAKRLANDGWQVCVTARRENKLQTLITELPSGNHLICPGDITDSSTAENIAVLIKDKWGGLDAIVHCAGVCETADIINTPLDIWRRPLDNMINAAIYLVRALVPLLPNGGRIVMVTSIHGDRVENLVGAYAMAKAALNQYCRALALELAPREILVNAIAPGFIDTPMSVLNGVNELESDWFRANYIDGHHLPLKRPGRPEEIAGVASFLIGPDSSYLTGQVITVDGGLTITF